MSAHLAHADTISAEELVARLRGIEVPLSPVARRQLLRALARPSVTSDALLGLADMADEAARSGAIPSDFEQLARVLRQVAPNFADTPLPGPGEDALPAAALREAAGVLDLLVGPEVAGVARLLWRMANRAGGHRA